MKLIQALFIIKNSVSIQIGKYCSISLITVKPSKNHEIHFSKKQPVKMQQTIFILMLRYHCLKEL